MTEKSALEAIRTGYTFDVPALDLGVALDGETPDPSTPVRIPLGMLNRHGLIAGATGTGKTVTLQVIAEQLSRAGVPVFAADIKGDLTGMASAGAQSEKLQKRLDAAGQEWEPKACPVEFYALGGEGAGIPLRATVSAFGPILLSKVLELNETQESVLGLIFHYADKAGLPLLNISDLRAVLTHLTSDEGKAELKAIGGVSTASAGVILRKLATLEAQGGDVFFGEPEFDTADLIRTTADGAGVVSMLELPSVQDRSALFSTFLMWVLADLFDDLPEVGDADKPKLVFFFDEAHLLFSDASKAFLEAVTRTVRLIRSKGVGIFFVTQTPKDVPEDVLAQLGSRVQHQLRAHTPNDAKALKATVQTFPTSDYDLGSLLTTLGTGEAVVTVMDPEGTPTPVAPVRMRAPESKMGPTSAEEMQAMIEASELFPKYKDAIDRDSAREMLARQLEGGAEDAEAGSSDAAGYGRGHSGGADAESAEDEAARLEREIRGEAEPARIPAPEGSGSRGSRSDSRGSRSGGSTGSRSRRQEKSVVEQVVQSSAFKQFTRTAAREIARGIFGTGRRRRRR